MGIVTWVLSALSGAALLYILAWPTPIEPAAYDLPKPPDKTGIYEPNESLAPLVLTPVGGASAEDRGPEDIAKGPDGALYTGLGSGRIMRIDPAAGEVVEIANAGGRPLGLTFGAAGNLIVADAVRGLLSVAPDGTISLLTDEVNGVKFQFLNALAVGADGRIWFTESTKRHDISGVFIDLYEARATGQLLCYDPASGETSIALDGLLFANGVTMGPDDAYILVAESRAARITRYWLKGDQAGKSDVFAENLPGLPDNISYDGKGLFWVALVLPRTEFDDAVAPYPFLRQVVMRLSLLPYGVFSLPLPPQTGAWVIALDESGEVARSLQSSSGKFAPVTSAHDFGDGIYLGSVATTAIARYVSPSP